MPTQVDLCQNWMEPHIVGFLQIVCSLAIKDIHVQLEVSFKSLTPCSPFFFYSVFTSLSRLFVGEVKSGEP